MSAATTPMPRAAEGIAASAPPRRPARDVLAWLTLALATLAILWPLGLSNRVLAGVDALTYFTPYWAYRMAELRAGQVPLWNPYLFLGVPFLANPQAAVLYPLHWPLSWLRAEQALIWSALIHAWLAAGFTYTFGRRSLRLSRLAAWLAGLIFGLGGFALARVENINQLNALAWLPALLWLYDETTRAAGWRSRLRWGAALAVAIALQFLAGHTQTTFVNMVGLGLWAGWPVLVVVWTRRGRGAEEQRSGGAWERRRRGDREARRRGEPGSGDGRAMRLRDYLLPLLAIIPAILLAAAQLLPTLELNGQGLRTGGLPYRQAVSFSLRPSLLAQSMLPPFGGGLAAAFGSEGYAEFVGYVGIAALVLAGIGLALLWRRSAYGAGSQWNVQRATVLAASGFLLALGAYNPLYYLLWRVIPGFDLFRAPARWLELYALGVAALAGFGLDVLASTTETRRHGDREKAGREHAKTSRARIWVKRVGIALVILVLVALLVIQRRPHGLTLAGWAVAVIAVAGLLWAARRWPRFARGGLVALTFLELWLGARALPFTLATAPSATSLRNAPAALLAATYARDLESQPPAGRDRFLSLSDIRFDPGDLAELRASQAGRLSQDAVERLVRAAKQVEVIAPNLPLLYNLPAVDGYDGGLLPLGRYVQLQSLFLPPELLVPDGRLREQLRRVPESRLLDLTGVRFVVTDKQRDLWADDVYYDLELGARLEPGQALNLDLSTYPRFSATALGIVAEAASNVPAETQLAELIVTDTDGRAATLDLRAGPATQAGGTPVRLRLAEPQAPLAITVRIPAGAPATLLRGISLIDERTGAHSPVTVSQGGDFRRIHSGDVKIYERAGAPGRAWLVHGIQPVADAAVADAAVADAAVADAATALALLGDPAFDPRASVVVADGLNPQAPSPAAPGESVEILDYAPERVVIAADVTSPAVLVLADSFYPGWQATVDGVSAPILRANLMFRGLALEPGRHEVVFTYDPATWRLGVAISLGSLAAVAAAVSATGVRRRRNPR